MTTKTTTKLATLTVAGDTGAASRLLAAMRAKDARPRPFLSEYTWHMGRWRRRVFLRMLPVLALVLVAGCAEHVELGVELDASLEDANVCPHVDTADSGHASVRDMCAAWCVLELACGIPEGLCIDRCRVPNLGRTEAHYYAVRECLAGLIPLTCEGWQTCTGLP